VLENNFPYNSQYKDNYFKKKWSGVKGCKPGHVWSSEGGSMLSFREQMRRFHDLLRQEPSFLFILPGWKSTPVASLMI
jgi:hypothetical protein